MVSNCGIVYPIFVIVEKGGFSMKHYTAPQLRELNFVAEEAISAPLEGSNQFNDGELEW